MLLVLLVLCSQFSEARNCQKSVITKEYSHSSSSHEYSHSSSAHETHMENVEFIDGNTHTGETVNLMSFASPPKIHYDISQETVHVKPKITYVKPKITYYVKTQAKTVHMPTNIEYSSGQIQGSHVNIEEAEPNVVVQPIKIKYPVKPVDINVNVNINDERNVEYDRHHRHHHKERYDEREHGKSSSSSHWHGSRDREQKKEACHRCPAPYCRGCKLTRKQVDDILHIVNNRRSLLDKHRQRNGHEGLLPQAKNMPMLSWCCGLEKQALRANIKHCPFASPRAPRGNALVYVADYDSNYKISDVLRKILSSIDSESLSDIHGTSVKYSGEENLKAYANLMRCDATKIGCAWVKCSGRGDDNKYALYCLLNKSDIREGDRIYDVRGRECRCRHCDSSGRCIRPPRPRPPPTPTPAPKPQANFYKEDPAPKKTPGVCLTQNYSNFNDTDGVSSLDTPCVSSGRQCVNQHGPVVYLKTPPNGTVREQQFLHYLNAAKYCELHDCAPSRDVFGALRRHHQRPNTICSWHDYMGDTMRMHMRDTHNFRRSQLALGRIKNMKGRKLPTATNMNLLVWDCQLEEEAYNYVKDCPSGPSGANNENFLRRRITVRQPTDRDINKLAVVTWWQVVRSHNLEHNVIFRAGHLHSPISSFTRMAWAKATKMGCVIGHCGNDFVQSCRYDPQVNAVNQQIYIPGGVCSKCGSLGVGPCKPHLGLCVK